VDENEERLEDLPWHPRILAQWEEQEQQELERQKRMARRQAQASAQKQEPQIVRPQVDRMEDLAWNPALLAEFERQERLGIGDGHAPPPSPAPTHRYTPHIPHAPQLSTAQRRRNQADQPRDRDGKYAEKPASKWKAAQPAQPAPRTTLKRVSTPARPVTSKTPWLHGAGQERGHSAPRRKKNQTSTNRLPSKMSMLNKPLHKKIGWVVRNWFRRKKRHLRLLFSLRG
jgi:hypothetical protein